VVAAENSGHFADHIIFLAVPFRVEQELPGIPCDQSVREGIERQKGLDARINVDLRGGVQEGGFAQRIPLRAFSERVGSEVDRLFTSCSRS